MTGYKVEKKRKQYYEATPLLDTMFRQVVRMFICVFVSKIIGEVVAKSLSSPSVATIFMAEMVSYALASVAVGIFIRRFELQSLLYGEIKYKELVYDANKMTESEMRYLDLTTAMNIYMAYVIMNWEAYSAMFSGLARGASF